MTSTDRGGFAELMYGLGEVYNEPISDARMELYLSALADVPLEAIRQAATLHVRTSKFFPRPAELREAIDGSVDDAAELAWTHLLREIRKVGYLGTPSWPDEATKRAAMDLFGSWPALCGGLPGGGPELLGYAKNFKASYAAYARREVRQQALPPSKGEATALLDGLTAQLETRGLPTGKTSTPALGWRQVGQ